MLYKAKDATNLRNHIEAAIKAALPEALQRPLTIKFNSSNIMHTGLEPEGDVFTIHVAVEVHEKKEKDAPSDVPAKSE